jgi:ferritin-like metal-binding protein YciE
MAQTGYQKSYPCITVRRLVISSRTPGTRASVADPEILGLKKGVKMTIESLQDLFETELRFALDCEQKLVKKGLPSMIEAANSPELRNALEQHLQETRNQVARLERVFTAIGAKSDTEDNDVFDELLNAAEDVIDDIDASPLRDAALIVCGNLVEHYEIALYGSLVAFAQQLGKRDAATLLQQTLDEEKAADVKLTQIGQRSINPSAAQQRKVA